MDKRRFFYSDRAASMSGRPTNVVLLADGSWHRFTEQTRLGLDASSKWSDLIELTVAEPPQTRHLGGHQADRSGSMSRIVVFDKDHTTLAKAIEAMALMQRHR